MEIDKDILLECICYFYKYNFSDVLFYELRGNWILATVTSDKLIAGYYVDNRSVDIDIDEYNEFIRIKKLNKIKNYSIS